MASEPIVIIGGGPAGMAAALAFIKTGREVRIYERYREPRPAGVILNLWPPPIRALEEMGVDVEDLGAPCAGTFRNATGYVRVRFSLPQDVIEKYKGGFVGLLRPDLYRRMIAAVPEESFKFNSLVTRMTDLGDRVQLEFDSGETIETPLVVGADGIDSFVRSTLWGEDAKRIHDLQVLGGYTVDPVPTAIPSEMVITYGPDFQASYSSIRTQGRDGFQWWTTDPWKDDAPAPADLKEHALTLASQVASAAEDIIRATAPENFQRWMIRDRTPLTRWSKGRVTLAGDAAHPTSPLAGYGAGMAIEDGYFIAKFLRGVDLSDTAAVEAALARYDEQRIPHTTFQVQNAYQQGRDFYHMPVEERAERDRILDETPVLQEQIGDKVVGDILSQLEEMGADRLAPAEAPVR